MKNKFVSKDIDKIHSSRIEFFFIFVDDHDDVVVIVDVVVTGVIIEFSFVAMEEKKLKAKKKKLPRQPGLRKGQKPPLPLLKPPKKPLSGYILFSNEQRPIVRKENPEIKFPEIARKLGLLWRTLPYEEKKIQFIGNGR